MKRCSTCGQEKDAGQFPPKRGQCRECISARDRAYKQTRPEVNRAYSRNWLKNHRAEVTAKQREWRAANRLKHRAQEAIKNAIAHGRIQRPDTCVACGARRYITGHHPDYSKPLEVQWLCVPCHRKADKARAA